MRAMPPLLCMIDFVVIGVNGFRLFSLLKIRTLKRNKINISGTSETLKMQHIIISAAVCSLY